MPRKRGKRRNGRATKRFLKDVKDDLRIVGARDSKEELLNRRIESIEKIVKELEVTYHFVEVGEVKKDLRK